MARTRNVLGRAENIELKEILDRLLVKDKDGSYSYIDGVSDASVAELYSERFPGLTVNNVKGLREDVFGKFTVSARAAELVSALTTKVKALEEEVGTLRDKLDFIHSDLYGPKKWG